MEHVNGQPRNRSWNSSLIRCCGLGHPSGDGTVTAGEDGTATIWDSQNRKALATPRATQNGYARRCLSPSRKLSSPPTTTALCACGTRPTGAPMLPPFAVPAAAPWAALQLSRTGGGSLVGGRKSGGRFRTCVLKTSDTGAKAAVWTGHVSMPRSVAFDPAGDRLGHRRWGEGPGVAVDQRRQRGRGWRQGSTDP